MQTCFSKRFLLGATLLTGGALLVGCGGSSSSESDPEGTGGVTADAATGGTTPDGGAGGATGGSEPPTGGTTGGSEPPTGGSTGGSTGGVTPPPTDECGADVALVDLNAEGTDTGGKLTYEGSTGTSDLFAASCSPENSSGSDALFKFTAPADGFWRFTTEGSVIDTVLYALTDCNDGFSEVACSDDVGGSLQSNILLDLHAGDVRYIVVDRADSADAGNFKLTAESIVAHKPTIAEFHAYYSADTGAAGIRVTGADEDADITQFKWGVFDAGGNQIQLDQAQNELIMSFADFQAFAWVQNPDGSFEAHGSAAPQSGFPQLSAMTFALGDANGLWSDPVRADVAPTDVVVAHGEVCDGARVLDACGEADACVDRDSDGSFTCETATAPVLTAENAYYNATTNGFGLHLVGDDAESDFAFVRIQALAADGSEVQLGDNPGPVGVGLYRNLQADGHFDSQVVFFGSFNAVCFPPAQQHFQDCVDQMRDQQECIDEANGLLDMCNREQAALVTHISVVPVDQALKAGAAVDVSVEPSPAPAAGGVCDVLYANGTCVEGEICAALPGGDAFYTCVTTDQTACPDDFGAINITADGMNGRWVARGDTTDATNHGGSGSCGGGGPQLVYQLTAPAAGVYHAETSGLGDGGDSLLFARNGCAFLDPTSELACNDDIDTQGGNYASQIDVMAEAGQDLFFFVDSYGGQFPSSFTLTVTGP